MVRVSEVLNPATWVPPSGLKMLFPNGRSSAVGESVYCIAMSIVMPVLASVRSMRMAGLTGVLARLRCLT